MNEAYIRNLNFLFKNAESIEKDSKNRGGVLAKLKLTQSDIDTLKQFEENGITICTDILLLTGNRVNITDLSIDDIVLLSLAPDEMKSKLNFGFYFTFNDFINTNNRKLNVEQYYILDKNISSIYGLDDEYINTYKIILALQNILKDISDNADEEVKYDTYTFFDSKKFKIQTLFQDDDISFILNSSPSFGHDVQKLYDELELASERQTRVIFFKKAIESTFKDRELSTSSIIRHLQNIFEEYEAHYRAYINSLEPEKIKYEFEDEHNKFLKELNSILGDVHNKVIFIPIAFIFGASQLTSGTTLKGMMIIFGMFIFSIFVSLFLDTHTKVLNILNTNIIDRKNFYKDENPSLYKKFKLKIEALEDLVKSIQFRISITKYSNWLLTIVVTIIFYIINS